MCAAKSFRSNKIVQMPKRFGILLCAGMEQTAITVAKLKSDHLNGISERTAAYGIVLSDWLIGAIQSEWKI